MNLEHVLSRRFDPIEQTYTWRDSALYALGVGFGADPLDEHELPYVCELREQRVVPSQCVTLGWPGLWHREPETGIDWVRILHGEQRFALHRPLPVAARVRARHRIHAVADKGPGRGALIWFDTDIEDAETREPIASLRSTQFLRGDGGCGSWAPPPAPATPLPAAKPDAVVDYRTLPQAALIYRLSGDLMPLHADPAVARAAGFERPISHGLATLGLACRAILGAYAPGAPERVASMFARFAAPAYPGDTLRFELFGDGDGIRFRARAVERDVVVLDRGECRLAPARARSEVRP